MTTLAINESGDIYMTARSLALAEGKECESVILHTRCKTQKGELQFDGAAGIDYFGTVFEDQRKAAACAAQIRASASKLAWVKRVKSLDYSVDAPKGTFAWKMVVIDLNGEEVTVGGFKKGESSDMGISWNEITDKPEGLETVSSRLNRLTALNVDDLTRSDSSGKIKETVNEIIVSIKSAKEA